MAKKIPKPKKTKKPRQPVAAPADNPAYGYFALYREAPLLGEVAVALADRTGRPLREVIESIDEFGVDNFWDEFAGPMLDRAQDALFDDDEEGK